MQNHDRATHHLTPRTARGEADYWLLRQFLSDTWPHMPPGYNWEMRRLDGVYFHNAQAGFDARWEGGQALALWEDGGRLVAAVHPEGSGQAWLEVDQAYRWLEPAMLDWAETHLARPGQDAIRHLRVFAWEYDTQRQTLLAARGYILSARGEVIREKPYGPAAPGPTALPAGYRLHAVRPGHLEDCARYAALLNAAFRRDFHQAQELITYTTHSPSFHPELELAAVAPDGSFAALTALSYDPVNHFAVFEPICAVPGPRPLGLTGRLMLEGWRRARALGAEHCYVGTGIGMAANRFYQAVGFNLIQTGWFWDKAL